jgi:hypothetical protein
MVPAWYWPSLTVLVIIVGVARVVHRSPLLPSRSEPGIGFLAVAGLGALVLSFHCAAMFFPRVVALVPGLDGPASSITALGAASRWAFWIPAGIVSLAAATLLRPAGAIVGVALVAVGFTMFRPAALSSHLLFIAVAVVAIAATGLGATRVRAARAA